MTYRVILDTDLGSDVDDAMALAMLAGREDVHLEAVTTVYGDTMLRAQLARRYLALAGRDVPVHAGLKQPKSGRDVWWAGHEGSLHSHLDSEVVAGTDAVETLVQAAAHEPGTLDVIAIGPLTNIAAALDADPHFEHNVRHLWVMAGRFGQRDPGRGLDVEHNIVSDSSAAQRVFSSNMEILVAGLDVTRKLRIDAEGLAKIRSAGPLGAALSADIDQWWAFWSETWNVPHDPVTVLTLVCPNLFTLSEPGRITVETQGKTEGLTTFTPGQDGHTRIVEDLDVHLVGQAIVDGIAKSPTDPK